MGCEGSPKAARLPVAACCFGLGLLATGASWAAPADAGAGKSNTIYTCVDSNGKRLTSDRPIAECTAREQRLLNKDGSFRKVVPPTLTADEQADIEARERAKAQRRATEMDAVRRDRNLRARYPNEAAHQKARVAALDDLRRTLQVSEKRLEALAVERKPLLDEAEFYVNRPMPTSLRQQLDGVEAAAEAQRSLIQNQQAEALRINATFDAELTRLRALWAGAPPGSLGPLVVVIPPAPAAPASGVPPAHPVAKTP